MPKPKKPKLPTPAAYRALLTATIDGVRVSRPSATMDDVALALFARGRRTVNRWLSGESPRPPLEVRILLERFAARPGMALRAYDAVIPEGTRTATL